MQEQLLDTYTDLMDKLAHTPDELAAVQERITELSLAAAEKERTLKDWEYRITEQAGGWAALGSNDKAREAALKGHLERSAQYFDAAQALRVITRELAVKRAKFDDLTRRWAGLGYQARLHAALLNYLGAAGVGVQPTQPAVHAEVVFPGPRPRNGDTAYVTTADAAALGL